MDNLDNKIKDILSQDINLSLKYKNMIRNTLQETKKFKSNKLIKPVRIISATCACIIITTSIVFGKDIGNFFKNVFNTSKGIDTAVENGYIVEPNMEYISSEGIDVKAENLLMDDYNLNFTLNIKFSENIQSLNVNKIELSDLIITDEENKIIYCSDKVSFDDYCEKNSLNYTYLNFNSDYINSGINWYIKSKNKEENSLNLVCNLYGEGYPKSKKINISFKTINIFNEEDYESKNITIKGEWNIPIDIPEKFYNRTSILYKVKSCSNPAVNITKAEVTNTGMKFEFFMQEDKIYEENDSEEVINQKIAEAHRKSQEEFLKNAQSSDFFDNYMGPFGRNTYVETESGKKFYASESNFEDNGYSNDFITGVLNYWQTYDLTSYDTTQKLKIYLQYEDQDIWIELER